MKTYDRILRAVCAIPWAIEESKLDEILAFLELKASAATSDNDLAAMRAAYADTVARSTAQSAGTVAVLPIIGTISHRTTMISAYSGGLSTDKFAAQFRAAVNDPNVKAIVFDVDSPGGTVDGVTELAAEIFKARGSKPIIAVANTLAASAAYWLACQADEVVVSPSAKVGSIGVFMVHTDASQAYEKAGVKHTLIKFGANKAQANDFTPLSDEAAADLQAMVDDTGAQFVADVARGRGVKGSEVTARFGQGRVFGAKEAVKLGMADRVATIEQVLAKYGVSRNNAQPMRAENDLGMSADDHTPKADDSAECICTCDPCVAGDCADCTHDPCDCAGCTCDNDGDEPSASAKEAGDPPKAVKERTRLKHQLDIASL